VGSNIFVLRGSPRFSDMTVYIVSALFINGGVVLALDGISRLKGRSYMHGPHPWYHSLGGGIALFGYSSLPFSGTFSRKVYDKVLKRVRKACSEILCCANLHRRDCAMCFIPCKNKIHLFFGGPISCPVSGNRSCD